MAIPSWAGRYVGIPYVERGRDFMGADCWGLCWLVMRQVFRIRLDIQGHVDEAAAAQAIRDGKGDPEWSMVQWSSEKAGDIAVIEMPEYRNWAQSHVGIIVAPGHILHTFRKHGGAVIAPYNEHFRIKPHGVRIAEIYRHSQLA